MRSLCSNAAVLMLAGALLIGAPAAAAEDATAPTTDASPPEPATPTDEAPPPESATPPDTLPAPDDDAADADEGAPPSDAGAFAWPSYVVESIEVLGNRRTRSDLILRQLTIRAGRPLDEDEVVRSRLRVLALGLFRDVSLRLRRGSQPGRVVLVVTVEERPTLVVSDLFLGFTEASPVYGGFGLADGNLFGRSLVASGAFVVGGEGRWAGRASLHDPDFLGFDVVAGLSGIWLRGVELDCPLPAGGCSTDDFDRLRYRRTGGIASLGLRSGRFSRIFLHYRGEDVASEVRDGTARRTGTVTEPHDLPYLEDDRSVISTIAASFVHDTRNDPFIATAGTQLQVSVEMGSSLFFSDYEFSRYSIWVARHLPGFSDHSIRLHVHGGFVQGDAPFFDRFHVADHSHFTVGDNTVPRALELSFTDVSQYDLVLLSLGADYQVPLFSGGRFVYRGYFYGAAKLTLSKESLDGSIWDLSRDPRNEVSTFPLSADIGLRVDTAMGVFSLGLAYVFDQAF